MTTKLIDYAAKQGQARYAAPVASMDERDFNRPVALHGRTLWIQSAKSCK